jgi:hypothetical protein
MPNRLATQTSPYLRQHKDNPVDWYPWGEEARARAQAERRPLLVSVGYSACHWCHVMERESFEDPEIAGVMSERFVCVKVDREEHPDVDAVCMEACQAMTGQGGWPLNAFLTPDLAPFFAGTYFPSQPRHGLPSWRAVLEAVAEAWDQRREEVIASSRQVLSAIGATVRLQPSPQEIAPELLDRAVTGVRASYDPQAGGFAQAPKFPMASVLEFLLARGEREMALTTLRAMAAGGIYDQLGGGFARYAVDANWTVPHFEKMLYDNALLARAYLHAWQLTGEDRMRRVATETLDWALREMRGPEGGFYSALDADSEGVEGRFYVWSAAELDQVLDDQELSAAAAAYFGVTPAGNFEGTNVLEARGPEPAQREAIRAKLYAARSARVWPGVDDKRLTSWNALMLTVLAEAGAVLERSDYLEAATAGAEFVLTELSTPAGRLQRTWKDGQAQIDAFLDDHAYLLQALIVLYEATFEPRWYHEATRWAETLIELFADPERGGFFTTSAGTSPWPRRKDLEDSPIPSGNSAAALALLRLSHLSGDAAHEESALGVLRLLHPLAERHPVAFGHALQAFDLYLAPAREVALVGPRADVERLARTVRASFRPHLVVAGGEADGVPLLAERKPVDGRGAAYVCENFSCRAPVTTPEALAAALDAGQSTGR